MGKVQITIHSIDKKACHANVDVDSKGYAHVAMPAPMVPTRFEVQYLDWDTANSQAAPCFTADDVLRAARAYSTTSPLDSKALRRGRVDRVKRMLRALFPLATFADEQTVLAVTKCTTCGNPVIACVCALTVLH